ncbi:MAG TPA: hypothetical protein VFA63_02885 [Pseudonocardiaceae bacterium]|nr:hypothetical protein [Pseudonocardiaceae bacterium]
MGINNLRFGSAFAVPVVGAVLLFPVFGGTAFASESISTTAAHPAVAPVLTDEDNDNSGVSEDTCPDADHALPSWDGAGKGAYTLGHKGCVFMHGGWMHPSGDANNSSNTDSGN